MNKTAMQELIEWIDDYRDLTHSEMKSKATELLDKEKEIIKDAYLEGQIDEGHERKHKDATDYYQKTYNHNL